MSLLNVWVSPTRALVAVDTLAAADWGPDIGVKLHTSKMLALPHAGVLLAGRGHNAVLGGVFIALASTLSSDLDGIDAVMPQLMGKNVARIVAKRREMGFDRPEISKQQLVLCGFSTRRGQMVALLYTIDDEGPASRTEIGGDGVGGDWLSAWDAAAQGEAPIPDSPDAMREVMRQQVQHLRVALPEATLAHSTTGGRAIVAELGRGSIFIRDTGPLFGDA